MSILIKYYYVLFSFIKVIFLLYDIIEYYDLQGRGIQGGL